MISDVLKPRKKRIPRIFELWMLRRPFGKSQYHSYLWSLLTKFDSEMGSVRVGCRYRIQTKRYRRRTCYLVTCSFYKCGQRGLFKYMNLTSLLSDYLEYSRIVFMLSHSSTIASPLSPLCYPAYPSLLPAFPLGNPALTSIVPRITSHNYPTFPSSRLLHRMSNSGQRPGGLLVGSQWGWGKGKGRVCGAPVIFNNFLPVTSMAHTSC